MTIDQCIESWINGNLSTVIDHVISRPTAAEVAYYAANIARELTGKDNREPVTFLTMLSNRIYHQI